MKSVSKRTPVIILAVSIFCIVIRYVTNYYYGFLEMPYTLFSVSIILSIVGIVMYIVVLITWLVSIVQKSNCLWTTTIMIGMLFLGVATNLITQPSDLILYGMRARLSEDYTLDTLRHFARDFDQLPDLKYNPVTPAKTYMNRDLVNTTLGSKYKFLNWMESPAGYKGPSFVSEENGVVNVEWGGALSDVWGFKVAVNGNPIVPDAGDLCSLRMSDDVYLFLAAR
jgi:hypothetical protein